jgi:hypothetical protein
VNVVEMPADRSIAAHEDFGIRDGLRGNSVPIQLKQSHLIDGQYRGSSKFDGQLPDWGKY